VSVHSRLLSRVKNSKLKGKTFAVPKTEKAKEKGNKKSASQAPSCKSDTMVVCKAPLFSSGSSRVIEEVNVADIQQPKQSPRDDAQEHNDDDDDDDDTLSQDMEEFLRDLEELKSGETKDEVKLMIEHCTCTSDAIKLNLSHPPDREGAHL
jgi:hypothetical protein